MSDLPVTINKTVMPMLQKCWKKNIAFLPDNSKSSFLSSGKWEGIQKQASGKINKSDLINGFFNALLDSEKLKPSDGILNQLPLFEIKEYNQTEHSPFTFRPGQCVEIVLSGHSLGICFWLDDRISIDQIQQVEHFLFNVSGVIEPLASMFTVLSRLLAAAISEWTDFPVRVPAAATPTGIHLDRLTKVFTNVSQPCAFVLPSPAAGESVITGDIIATDALDGRCHIGVRFGSAQRKKHTPENVDPLQNLGPNLFYQIDAALRDAVRPPQITLYKGFGFSSIPLYIIGRTLESNYQNSFNSLPAFSHLRDLISTETETETNSRTWHNDPVVDFVAKKRSESMAVTLTEVFKEIYRNNVFMGTQETLRTLETWAEAISRRLYSTPPGTYNQYHNEERVNSNAFFTLSGQEYSSAILTIDEGLKYDVGNMPVWEHELSGLPFWSVVIAVHSYTTVVQAFSDNELLRGLLLKLQGQHGYGLEYIAWALAVGTLLRSAEFTGQQHGEKTIAQLLDMPSILSDNFQANLYYQDISGFLMINNLLSDYRTLQSGMLWIHTNAQAMMAPMADLAMRLFCCGNGNNQRQWLNSAIKHEHDISPSMGEDRVMTIESTNGGWDSQLESDMYLGCSLTNTHDTGRVLFKFTFPDIIYGQENVANTGDMLFIFLSEAFRKIDANTQLIAASDCYMEYLLPAHFTLKTKEQFVLSQPTKNPLPLSVAYTQMIKASDALDTFRYHGGDYRFIHNLSIRRFLPALWLNIGFSYETYLQDLCSRLFFICSPEARNYVLNLFNLSLNHKTDLASLRFSSNECPDVVIDMPMIILNFISEYTNGMQAQTDDEFNLFNLWFDYISKIKIKKKTGDVDTYTNNFITAYQGNFTEYLRCGKEKNLEIVTNLINYMRDNFKFKPWLLTGYLSGMNSQLSSFKSTDGINWLLMVFMGLNESSHDAEYKKNIMLLLKQAVSSIDIFTVDIFTEVSPGLSDKNIINLTDGLNNVRKHKDVNKYKDVVNEYLKCLMAQETQINQSVVQLGCMPYLNAPLLAEAMTNLSILHLRTFKPFELFIRATDFGYEFMFRHFVQVNAGIRSLGEQFGFTGDKLERWVETISRRVFLSLRNGNDARTGLRDTTWLKE